MAEIDKKELQNIKALEDELIEDQQLEVLLRGDNNTLQKLITAKASKAAIYTKIKEQEKLKKELEIILESLLDKANSKGRLRGRKAMKTFLEASERKDIKQKSLDKIALLNKRAAEARKEVALLELEKEFNILKADIDIFRKNSMLAGFSAKETLSQLVKAGSDETGIAQGFAKAVKSAAVAAQRREKSAAEIDEYKKVVKSGGSWTWITISTNPCPDCEARAGVSLPLARWKQLGLPGEGRTICGKFCRCKLMPDQIADDRHPTIRVFDWNKKDTVLTTASEARVLAAKSNKTKGSKLKVANT